MNGSLTVKNDKYYIVLSWYDDSGKRKQKWIKTGLPEKNNRRKAEEMLRAELQKYSFPDTENDADEDEEQGVEDISPEVYIKTQEPEAAPKPKKKRRAGLMFTDVVPMWLEEAEKRVGPVTFEGYSRMSEDYVIPYFSREENNFFIDEASFEGIQKFVDYFCLGREREPVSPKTIRHFMIVVRQTLVYACRHGYAKENPCNLVVLPKMIKREPSILSEKQLGKFFEIIKDDPMFPLIYVTVFLGLRRSEALGLKWDSIDFDARTITIKHTVVKSETKRIIEQDTTKTASSHRVYPLTSGLLDLFLAIKASETENREKFGDLYRENDYVFKWDYGKIYDPDFVTRHFKRLLKKAGMPEIRFHDLRHSCASLLVSKGFKLKDIQEWLGHADIQTTANTYAHLYQERNEKIAQSFSFDESLLAQPSDFSVRNLLEKRLLFQIRIKNSGQREISNPLIHKGLETSKAWSECRDSNSGPRGPKPRALPPALHPEILNFIEGWSACAYYERSE